MSGAPSNRAPPVNGTTALLHVVACISKWA